MSFVDGTCNINFVKFGLSFVTNMNYHLSKVLCIITKFHMHFSLAKIGEISIKVWQLH